MLKFLSISSALSLVMTLSSPVFSATDDKGGVIAKVNNDPIYMSDLKQIENSYPPETVTAEKAKDKNKFYANLRDRAIDMYILKKAAETSSVDKSADFQKKLDDIKSQLLIQAFVEQNLKSQVTEAAIKAKFDEFLKRLPKNEEEVKIRHIMVDTEAAAKQIIQELKKGADFQKLAREKSKDEKTATEGGDLGFIRKTGAETTFTDAAFALKIGSFSETPVKTDMGWHVLKADDRRKVKPPKLTDPQIEDALRQVVFQEKLKAMVDDLRDKSRIERFTEDGKPTSITADSMDKAAAEANKTSAESSVKADASAAPDVIVPSKK